MLPHSHTRGYKWNHTTKKPLRNSVVKSHNSSVQSIPRAVESVSREQLVDGLKDLELHWIRVVEWASGEGNREPQLVPARIDCGFSKSIFRVMAKRL